MTVLEKIRGYHAVLAATAVAAYATGELGLIHAWIGYAVAVVIALRLVWGLFGPKQVGISRFIPDLAEVQRIRWLDHPAVSRLLISAVAASLIAATVTGLAIDRTSQTPGGSEIAASAVVPTSLVQSDKLMPVLSARPEEDDEEGESWLGELHEASANLFLLCVGLHVAYCLQAQACVLHAVPQYACHRKGVTASSCQLTETQECRPSRISKSTSRPRKACATSSSAWPTA